MQRLVTMLQQAEEYVGTVVDGKLPADPHMGRKVGVFFCFSLSSVVCFPEKGNGLCYFCVHPGTRKNEINQCYFDASVYVPDARNKVGVREFVCFLP